MNFTFHKYHALGNDFIVFGPDVKGITAKRLPDLAMAICQRSTGIGADGIVWLTSSTRADGQLEIYNADGSWAEKSGNGLRIAALHLSRMGSSLRNFALQTGTSLDRVKLIRKIPDGYMIRAELGEPTFEAAKVPVKSEHKFVINRSMKIGEFELPMTCVAIGNPHAVVIVDNFDLDWHTLGSDIETSKLFPNGTNVEFVRPVNRKKLKLREWERGVGATESCGTGAAAAVCALVMMGLADRQCEVEFEAGSLSVEWHQESNLVGLTGPVEFISTGEFDLR
jgi:diaminopimelate epimerase